MADKERPVGCQQGTRQPGSMWLAVSFVTLYIIICVTLGLTLTAILAALHLFIIPLLFRYSKAFQRQIVFLNYVQWPIHPDFAEPSKAGLHGARNLYIEHVSKISSGRTIKIGIWHVLPQSVYERCALQLSTTTDAKQVEDIFDKELTSSGRPVILYCHGNANHRAAHHRVKLYQVLQKMDLHVIAFDYRGYGDSSAVRLSEPAVVEDALAVYGWLRGSVDQDGGRPPVYLWGHSLGSGIASHLVGNLGDLSCKALGRPLPLPDGLVLESAFNNLRDVVDNHFMTVMVRWLPYYGSSFVAPFAGRPDHEFTSDRHLPRVSLPTLVLHARDDYVIPHRLGVKLHTAILATRPSDAAHVTFHTYDGCLQLGHTWICEAEDLPRVFSDFMAKTSAAE